MTLSPEVPVSINAIVHTFEGTALQTLTWDDRPCWVARHVGETIGYENGGRKFAQRVLGAWSKEMEEGRDYAFLTGPELDAFKAVSPDMAPSRGHVDHTARVLVLFESGLHMALLKTSKPLGVRLRRFLADEVLPQLVRTGTYTPAAPSTDAALVRRVEALEQVSGRMDRLETAMVKLTELVTTLASAGTQPAQGPRVTVNAPGAQITLIEPTPPPGFTISGIKLLASIEQCSHPKLRKRLETVGLWEDPEWMWVGERTIPRGNRLDTETFYRFKPSILPELKRRENPLPFPGRGDA